ncbi:hypothetical protein GCM10027046_01360 [Uliginosibacterium flavum]|uniref:MotA/TolQ/ExbB proton channel domain-containing protein n=1 Tax=Uliginosibacterium flavum TaxID=1396831 RepID=A0ABV2THD8_9RHOO
MDLNSLFAQFVQFSSYLPLLLIYGVGLALAVTRLPQQRRFARLCIAGFCGHLFGLLISAGTQFWLIYAAQTERLASANFLAVGVVQLIVMLFACCGWVLLLIALFSGRSQTSEDSAA